MSDYDEDVFFDEEDEKEKIEKEIISEDDFYEDFHLISHFYFNFSIFLSSLM